MLEMTNENVARLLRGLTIAVGNRKNRILIYQFLAAEIRALHYSYGVGDGESYKRALTFLEECEKFTLRSLVRKSTERRVEVTVDHAKRVFLRALKKLNAFTGRRSGSMRVRHPTKNMGGPGERGLARRKVKPKIVSGIAFLLEFQKLQKVPERDFASRKGNLLRFKRTISHSGWK